MRLAPVLFWLALAVLAYTYTGYFALLRVLAPIVSRRRGQHRPDENHRPTISMIISLHNEEKLIGQRLDNFEALDYPTDKLELLLGDDCSTDRTCAIIRERIARNPRIRLVEFDTHQGKTAVINHLVPVSRGEIIALSDGNTFFERDALAKMARHFSDPRVGTVCGHMLLHRPTGQNLEHQYWRSEAAVKMLENDLGVVLGANGGIYALRKELFQPLAAHVIQIDDFIWPVRVYEQGFFGVYDRAAVATEEVSPTLEAEFRRKIRIGTGNYRALIECRRLLSPRRGWIAFAFWSHKVLRWASPFLLAVVLAANALLLSQPRYRVLLAVQVAFYLSAGIGRLSSRGKHPLARLFHVPYYFVGSNLALLVGCYKCVTGRQTAAWSQKAHRAR